MNKSIASTQGQKNKRYSVKKPSIAHFFVSQSRLTDAVSVIFGELLSYEHPPKAGGYFLAYTVPVTVSTAVPGVVLYAPVAASCVKVAAGTVTTPAAVANTPVAAS